MSSTVKLGLAELSLSPSWEERFAVAALGRFVDRAAGRVLIFARVLVVFLVVFLLAILISS